MGHRWRLQIAASLLAVVSSAAWAGKWAEEDFYRKMRLVVPYEARLDADPSQSVTVIGSTRHYQAR